MTNVFVGKAWSPDEDIELIQYLIERRSWSWIGVQLGRSVNDIRHHWNDYVRHSDAARGVEYNPRR